MLIPWAPGSKVRRLEETWNNFLDSRNFTVDTVHCLEAFKHNRALFHCITGLSFLVAWVMPPSGGTLLIFRELSRLMTLRLNSCFQSPWRSVRTGYPELVHTSGHTVIHFGDKLCLYSFKTRIRGPFYYFTFVGLFFISNVPVEILLENCI